jgi:hypothetical protein
MLLIWIAACFCPCVTMGEEVDRQLAFAAATWVADGRVVAASVVEWTVTGLTGNGDTVPSTIEYRFLITRQWKGPAVDTLRVSAPLQTTSCGQDVELGKSYLLYLHRGSEEESPRSAELDRCTRRFEDVQGRREREWLDSRP